MRSTVQVETWLYTTIVALPAVTSAMGQRVYKDTAPAGALAPFIAYHLSGGNAIGPLGGRTTSEELLFAVQLIAEGESTTTIEAAAAAVQTALDFAETTTADGFYLSSTYLRPASFPLPVEEGRAFRQLAAEFQVFVGYP